MQFQWAFKFVLFLLGSMLVHCHMQILGGIIFVKLIVGHWVRYHYHHIISSSQRCVLWGTIRTQKLSFWKDYLVSGAAGYVSFCQGAPDNVLDGILDAFFHIWLDVFAGSRSWQTDTDDPSLEGPSLVGSTPPTNGGYYQCLGKVARECWCIGLIVVHAGMPA